MSLNFFIYGGKWEQQLNIIVILLLEIENISKIKSQLCERIYLFIYFIVSHTHTTEILCCYYFLISEE